MDRSMLHMTLGGDPVWLSGIYVEHWPSESRFLCLIFQVESVLFWMFPAGSCATWVGQCFTVPGGGQVLNMLWMLRSAVTSLTDNWDSTRWAWSVNFTAGEELKRWLFLCVCFQVGRGPLCFCTRCGTPMTALSSFGFCNCHFRPINITLHCIIQCFNILPHLQLNSCTSGFIFFGLQCLLWAGKESFFLFFPPMFLASVLHLLFIYTTFFSPCWLFNIKIRVMVAMLTLIIFLKQHEQWCRITVITFIGKITSHFITPQCHHSINFLNRNFSFLSH